MMEQLTVVGLLALLVSGAPGKSPRPLRIERASDGGMVGLSDGMILAWNVRGQIQLRSPAGAWLSVRQLPASFVVGASGRRDVAYLIANVVGPGSAPSRARAVATQLFSVRSNGEVEEVSGLPEGITSVASTDGRGWIAAPAGVFELLSNATLGSRLGDATVATVLVARSGAAPIVCTEADLSQAHYRPATCRSDAPPWFATGSWTSPPFACADVLIEKGDGQLVTRSMATGHALAHAAIPRTASVTCGDASVLVGTDRIRALDPETLRPRWSAKPIHRPITAIQMEKDQLVYFTPDGPSSSPRPQRPRRPK